VFLTIWTLTQVYPLEMLMVSLLNWTLGYWIGRAMLRKLLLERLNKMTTRYVTAQAAANCWKDEVEDLATKVKE